MLLLSGSQWDPFTEDNIRKLEAVQRRAARFVCNNYRQTASVSSMLSELSWPLLEQRRAEARLGLFHRIVHKSVDIDAATLMTRSTRPTRKANEVQYTGHMTSKDCYKCSFIPRTIIQWNGIAATGDFNQYKSDLKSHDLTLSGPAARMLLKERCSLLLQIQMIPGQKLKKKYFISVSNSKIRFQKYFDTFTEVCSLSEFYLCQNLITLFFMKLILVLVVHR